MVEGASKDLTQFMEQHLDWCKMLHDAQRDENRRVKKLTDDVQAEQETRLKIWEEIKDIRRIAKCPDDHFFDIYKSYMSQYDESKRRLTRLEDELQNTKIICKERVRFARDLVSSLPSASSTDVILQHLQTLLENLKINDLVWVPVSSSEYHLARIIFFNHDKLDVYQGTATVRLETYEGKDGKNAEFTVNWSTKRIWNLLPSLQRNNVAEESLAFRALCLPDVVDFVYPCPVN